MELTRAEAARIDQLERAEAKAKADAEELRSLRAKLAAPAPRELPDFDAWAEGLEPHNEGGRLLYANGGMRDLQQEAISGQPVWAPPPADAAENARQRLRYARLFAARAEAEFKLEKKRLEERADFARRFPLTQRPPEAPDFARVRWYGERAVAAAAHLRKAEAHAERLCGPGATPGQQFEAMEGAARGRAARAAGEAAEAAGAFSV